MPENKQLTVAELLARAEKDAADGSSRPRRARRRRSLEEGGISVAELTGSIKKVEEKPVESKHSSVPIDAPTPAQPVAAQASTAQPSAAQPSTAKPKQANAPLSDETTEIRKVTPSTRETSVIPKVPSDPRLDEFGERPGETSVAEKTHPVKGNQPAGEGAGVGAESDTRDSLTGSETAVVAAPDAEDADAVDAQDEGAVNPIMLVLFVFFGLIAGVAGFFAFQWVWANLGTLVAALLALVAVVAVVYGVRALRTGRDGLTMTLAGVASAVVAFGPALLV